MKQTSFSEEIIVSNFGVDTGYEILEMISNCTYEYDEIDKILNQINDLLCGFGIESVVSEHVFDRHYINIALLYINLGDSYKTTILFDCVNKIFVCGSWEDFVASNPSRFDV